MLFMVVNRLRRPRVATADTSGIRLVIEGYPRSANTFVRHALRISQGNDDWFATHFHASANVVLAVRQNIPTVVLIRRPRDAIASVCLKLGGISLREAQRDWIAYYERVLPYRDQILVVPFEQATRDFPRVVSRINQRFGLELVQPAGQEEVRAEAFESISAKRRVVHGEDLPEGFVTNMPDASRDERKSTIVAAYDSAGNTRQLTRAERLYAFFLGLES